MREPFSPQFFQRLQQLKIRTRRSFLGSRQGLHVSNRRGHGLEFADYRLYTAGDDFRHIDWGVYGRTDRLYVRQFRDEQDLNVLFLLDASSSMAHPAGEHKFDLARDLAIALGYVALASGDTVRYALLGQKSTPQYRGPKALSKIFRELDAVRPSGSFRYLDEVRTAAARLRIPGKCFLISDLLFDPNEVFELLDHLRARNFEIAVLQILAPSELRLELDVGEHLLVDSESGAELQVALSPSSRREYVTLLAGHISAIEHYCLGAAIPHVLISSADSVADIVLTRLPQLGLLK